MRTKIRPGSSEREKRTIKKVREGEIAYVRNSGGVLLQGEGFTADLEWLVRLLRTGGVDELGQLE